jgi:tetratricopeptide (TPR) repeat protein
MPTVASSNIAHTAITDHRIPRIPGKDWGNSRQRTVDDKYPIVSFAKEADVSGLDQQRDLGIALIEFASKQPFSKAGHLAGPLLDQSLSLWPVDMPAWEAKGYALMLQDRNEEALSAFETALRLSPGREKSLFGAALIAARLGRVENSVKYWKDLIALNPWNREYHDELAKIYAEQREWKLAAEQCVDALKLNLAAWDTRKLLVKSLLRLGKKSEAQEEFEILLGFEPPDPDSLRRWYAEEDLEK